MIDIEMPKMTVALTTRRFVDGEPLIPVDSDNAAHSELFKTLDLLAIDTTDGPLYFVLEGIALFGSEQEVREARGYFYEEHTCPTNFIRDPVVAIFADGDDDPHGVFRFVDFAWMTLAYIDAKAQCRGRDYLSSVFPQLTG